MLRSHSSQLHCLNRCPPPPPPPPTPNPTHPSRLECSALGHRGCRNEDPPPPPPPLVDNKVLLSFSPLVARKRCYIGTRHSSQSSRCPHLKAWTRSDYRFACFVYCQNFCLIILSPHLSLSLFCSISVLRHIMFITSHRLHVIVMPTIFQAPNKLQNFNKTR